MRYRKFGNIYVIRLESGEKVIESLTEFCRENGIKGGFFNGIGALASVELGHYSTEKKGYSRKQISEEVEILSMKGNITEKKIHCHISVAPKDMHTYGGHLFDGTVSATCEIFLTKLDRLSRFPDSKTGLDLLDL